MDTKTQEPSAHAQQVVTIQREVLQRIALALYNAGVLCDAVPTRLQNHDEPAIANIGSLVNEQGVYGQVRDAHAELKAALAAQQSATLTDEQIVSAAIASGLSEFIGADRAELGPQLRQFARAVLAAAQQPAVIPPGWKLVPDYQVGMHVRFNEDEYRIFALGDKPGTFDLEPVPCDIKSSRWLSVHPDAMEPLAPQPAEAQPVQWGAPKTVGMLIRQLQTMDADMPVHGAFFTELDGVRRAFIRPVSLSRERVRAPLIDQGNTEVPYSLVIWSEQDERQPAASGEPRPTLTVGKEYLLRTCDHDGNDKPRSEWIRATWDGTHLRDADGSTWTEWLTHYSEDIVDPDADSTDGAALAERGASHG